jgi:hypothetical protein
VVLPDANMCGWPVAKYRRALPSKGAYVTDRPDNSPTLCFGTSMPNDTEAMAMALIRLLHEATGGEAMRWQTIRPIDGIEDALLFAFQQGWLLTDGDRAALTELGCSIAEELGRPLH